MKVHNIKVTFLDASQIAKKAYADDISLKQAAQLLNILNPEDFDKLVNPEDMLKPRE